MASSNREAMLKLRTLSQRKLMGSCSICPALSITRAETIVMWLIFFACIVTCISGAFLGPRDFMEDLCPNTTDSFKLTAFSRQGLWNRSGLVVPGLDAAGESCEDRVETCQCRTFLMDTYECKPACPILQRETNSTNSSMPLQFWRYLTGSVFDPFLYKLEDRSLDFSFWRSLPYDSFITLVSAIYMGLSIKAFRCTRCQQQDETVATMRCLSKHYSVILVCSGYFAVIQSLDLVCFIVNFARRDVHSIQQFLFVTGGLPQWLTGLIVSALVIFFVFKIIFLYVVIVCCVTYLRIWGTARGIKRKLERSAGKDGRATNEDRLLP